METIGEGNTGNTIENTIILNSSSPFTQSHYVRWMLSHERQRQAKKTRVIPMIAKIITLPSPPPKQTKHRFEESSKGRTRKWYICGGDLQRRSQSEFVK